MTDLSGAARSTAARYLPVLAIVALGLLVLWPIFAPGFVLTFDMVFVPKLSLTRDLLGLGTAVPRAVPNDLIVAVLSRAIPAMAVQKVILAGILAGAGFGAARLVPTHRPGARAAGASLYMWNAFVYERLLLGHWTLLIGYAALPWVARAAIDLGGGVPRAGRRLAGSLAVASLGGAYGGVTATATALVVASMSRGAHRHRRVLRSTALIVAAGLVLNAPWLVPSLLRPGGLPVRPSGPLAFRARTDSPLGTAGSLLTLGGIWDRQVVPPGRANPAWIPAFALILLIACAGWRVVLRRWPHGAGSGLLTAAALGFVVAVSPAVPGLRVAYTYLTNHVFAGGVLRDSQKFIMPLALAESVGFGAGVERILDAAASARTALVATALLVLAPVAALPALAWGAAGRLGTTQYPRDWVTARATMAFDRAPGGLLVLPWHLYVAFPWNDQRTVLNPAQRFFTRRAVLNDDLELRTQTIRGEDPWSSFAQPVVHSSLPIGPELPKLGIRYVLLLKTEDWARFSSRLTGLDRVLDGPTLDLYRARPAPPLAFPTAPTPPVLIADVATGLVVLWLAGTGALAVGHRSLLFFRRAKD